MAPDPNESSMGFLVETNVPLSKMPIRDDVTVSDIYDLEFRPFARGKYAQVKRCKHRQTGVEFAAKFIRRRRRSADMSHEILHEVRVLLLASKCDRIIGLHEVFVSATEYVLILELAQGGELQRLLDGEDFLPEKQTARIVRQVLEAISYLHEHQIAHLDIKPQNILLTGQYPAECDIKLCDFGISRHISNKTDLREIVGTPDYVSPEILHYEPISLATDMWSVGCLTYVLLTGYSPFGAEDKQTTFCNITQAKVEFPDEFFADISTDAIDFISKLLVKEPKKRMSCLDALDHPWLASICCNGGGKIEHPADLNTTGNGTTNTVNGSQSILISQSPNNNNVLITPAVVANQQQALLSPTIVQKSPPPASVEASTATTVPSSTAVDSDSMSSCSSGSNDSDKENN